MKFIEKGTNSGMQYEQINDIQIQTKMNTSPSTQMNKVTFDYDIQGQQAEPEFSQKPEPVMLNLHTVVPSASMRVSPTREGLQGRKALFETSLKKRPASKDFKSKNDLIPSAKPFFNLEKQFQNMESQNDDSPQLVGSFKPDSRQPKF